MTLGRSYGLAQAQNGVKNGGGFGVFWARRSLFGPLGSLLRRRTLRPRTDKAYREPAYAPKDRPAYSSGPSSVFVASASGAGTDQRGL
jgi:hypothetical protein